MLTGQFLELYKKVRTKISNAYRLVIGTVRQGSVADATITNTVTPDGVIGTLDLVLPKGDKGDKGDAATIQVGTVTTGNPGSNAQVTNSGTSANAVFDFTIPKGATGNAATVQVGTTSTGNPGTNASVSNRGSSGAAILDFTIPRGNTGAQGPQPVFGVPSISTLNPGTNATVSISGAGTAASPYALAFGIPRGNTGSTGATGPSGTAQAVSHYYVNTSYQPSGYVDGIPIGSADNSLFKIQSGNVVKTKARCIISITIASTFNTRSSTGTYYAGFYLYSTTAGADPDFFRDECHGGTWETSTCSSATMILDANRTFGFCIYDDPSNNVAMSYNVVITAIPTA